MTNELYQNNSQGFLPYASCNINAATGCNLDPNCTLHSNCLQMVTADYGQMQQQVAEATRDLEAEDFKRELLTPQQAYDKLMAYNKQQIAEAFQISAEAFQISADMLAE